jgi:hypothetical protein
LDARSQIGSRQYLNCRDGPHVSVLALNVATVAGSETDIDLLSVGPARFVKVKQRVVWRDQVHEVSQMTRGENAVDFSD